MDDDQGKTRSENEVFEELRQTCQSPGFIHALSFLAFRDSLIFSEGEELQTEDLLPLFSHDHLVRTELSTLLGLLVQAPIDFEHPGPAAIQGMINSADCLLQEIHHTMMPPLDRLLGAQQGEDDPAQGPILFSGEFLREPIFYGGESAYVFQYRDLAVEKYAKDAAWFLVNKRFHPDDMAVLNRAVASLFLKKLEQTRKIMMGKHPDEWTVLAAYEFSVSEITIESGLDEDRVRALVTAFSCPIGENSEFSSISDFNLANAYPLIQRDVDTYFLFHSYSLAEAAYETPFFWMLDDKDYMPSALEHRGGFTEEVCLEFMSRVFSPNNLHPNVTIVDSRGNHAGEIDLLVVYANRAIVLQAKSKKLTIAARKGNDLVIREDFKKAVQDAYDQGASCSKMIMDRSYKLVAPDGTEISIRHDLDEVFLLCALSDHYPALSFQTRQFLATEEIEKVRSPFVSDVFFLDAATEMLRSPVRFMSYLNRRSAYQEKILATNELIVLSYHLKLNLWLDPQYTMVNLGDDISADLDLAMMVRREGVPGKDTPDGILTRFLGTPAGLLLEQIEDLEESSSIDLGYLLLELSEDALNDLSTFVDTICAAAISDRKLHDATMAIAVGRTGITVHASYESDTVAYEKLGAHMALRKYMQRANSWYGIAVIPDTKKIRLGVKIENTWEYSPEMEEAVQERRQAKVGPTYRQVRYSNKIGRNDQCPCGSGKKYKKCCLP